MTVFSPTWSGTSSGTTSVPRRDGDSWSASRTFFMVAMLTTSSAVFVPPSVAPAAIYAPGATADHAMNSLSPKEVTPPSRHTTAALVRDLKARSGLTWDQLASAFGVSRRAVHGWAAGSRLNAGHAESLATFSALVHASESNADTDTTRQALLDAVSRAGASLRTSRDGRGSPLDVLSVRHVAETWSPRDGDSVPMIDAD